MGENYSDVKISVIVIMSKSTLDQWSKFLSSVSAQVEINYRFDCQTGPVTQLPFLFRGSAKKEMYPRDKATVGQVTFHSDSDILLLIFVLLCCSGWDIGPRREELADVWIDHGAFNDTLVRNYMHPDTLLIACVREPVSWFKSATKYFSHTRRYVSFINTSPLACLDKLALLVVGLLVSPSHYQQALSRQANFTICPVVFFKLIFLKYFWHNLLKKNKLKKHNRSYKNTSNTFRLLISPSCNCTP